MSEDLKMSARLVRKQRSSFLPICEFQIRKAWQRGAVCAQGIKSCCLRASILFSLTPLQDTPTPHNSYSSLRRGHYRLAPQLNTSHYRCTLRTILDATVGDQMVILYVVCHLDHHCCILYRTMRTIGNEEIESRLVCLHAMVMQLVCP